MDNLDDIVPDISFDQVTQGLSITLTRPECTDSGGRQSAGGGGIGGVGGRGGTGGGRSGGGGRAGGGSGRR